ncbi:MAG: hypothetical protein H0V51_24490 [Chloroflexi bacterium]|nr:hypothetical protein [Chloroflexota bacterium]
MPGRNGRRLVRLTRSGGSRAAVVPATWLKDLGVDDVVAIEQTAAGILITRPEDGAASIEDEPQFATFLHWVATDALAHPDGLGDIGELMAEDADLYAGVEPDGN